jgi:hypothetical protein
VITNVKVNIMKKLDDIPKKNIFNVPDRYFEQLPNIIQAQVVENTKSHTIQWSLLLRYATPVLILAGIGVFWLTRPVAYRSDEVETELESVASSQLYYFLNDTDVSTEELIEDIIWNAKDLEILEDEVYADLNKTGLEWNEVLDSTEL